MHENNEIIIIGAGPAGLFSIFECGMLGIKSHIIDTLEFIGGQCNALYPEKPIYDIPAYPEISAENLIKQLEIQAKQFNPTYHLGEQVLKLHKNDNDSFEILTNKGTKLNARAIIIAGGCGSFGPNRPPLKDIEKYEGKTILYMVGSREKFRDSNIVIAGGGDSAIDWAISLSEVAKKVYVVHRRAKFRCAPDSYAKMQNIKNIELVIPYQLEGLDGNNGYLSEVIVKDMDENVKILKADYLLPFFGLSMELGPINNWGINISKHHIEVNPATMETNIAGIYAIGDIATYFGKLKLILTGFSEGAIAAHNAYHNIFPGQALHFEYSTSKGIKV